MSARPKLVVSLAPKAGNFSKFLTHAPMILDWATPVHLPRVAAAHDPLRFINCLRLVSLPGALVLLISKKRPTRSLEPGLLH